MQEKPYVIRAEEYYSGRFREGTVLLTEAEADRLIRFLREEEQEPDIYNSCLEERCPELYHRLDDAAVPLMDALEAEESGGFYGVGIPEEIVRTAFSSGLTHTSELIVSEQDTARALGSGTLEVLATPRVAALMENAAMRAVAPILEPGCTTVGGEISFRHLAPSPVGASVSATAILERTEGRRLFFRLEARQGATLIADGTHTRFIVDTGRFLKGLHK